MNRNAKTIIYMLVFLIITAVLMGIGIMQGFYTPCAPAEGEAPAAWNWLCCMWWLATGIFFALAISRLARISSGEHGMAAGLKLAIYVIAAIVFTGGLVMATSDLGVNINAIIISLGIVSTCIAIGCEPLMYDVMGGLGIMSAREFEVGDIISVDGFRGEVTDISLRSVKIRDQGGSVKVIRNSEIASVVNLSKGSAAVVRIPYDPDGEKLADFEAKVEACITAFTEAYPEIFTSRPEY